MRSDACKGLAAAGYMPFTFVDRKSTGSEMEAA